MTDVDINFFGEHESRTEEPTDKNIPLTLVTPGRSTWEPDGGEQETSFGSPEVLLSRGDILHKVYLVDWNLISDCSNLIKMEDYIIKGNL